MKMVGWGRTTQLARINKQLFYMKEYSQTISSTVVGRLIERDNFGDF